MKIIPESALRASSIFRRLKTSIFVSGNRYFQTCIKPKALIYLTTKYKAKATITKAVFKKYICFHTTLFENGKLLPMQYNL